MDADSYFWKKKKRLPNVMSNSIRDIAASNDTYIAQIQQDIKCGLVFIKSLYPHFTFDKFTKKVLVDDCA